MTDNNLQEEIPELSNISRRMTCKEGKLNCFLFACMKGTAESRSWIAKSLQKSLGNAER